MIWNWLHLETRRFEMGSDRLVNLPTDDEGPTRTVTVGSLSITSGNITNAQFHSFVIATKHQTTAETTGSGLVVDRYGNRMWVPGASWRDPLGDSSTPSPNAPVVQVSWFDCQEFCRWSGTVLPTEAQWARSESKFRPDKSGVALPALWQWCSDYYHPTFHRGEQRVNPTGPTSGNERVLRGGSLTPTERRHELPDLTSNGVGFRVVRGRLWEGTPADESLDV